MLLKKPVAGGKVEVTFRMPPLDDVVELSLCGDFNNWNVKGVPLSQDSDGTWFATIVLDAGKSYRFRYYDNQGRWHNDREADAYVPNEFGSEDSLLDRLERTRIEGLNREKAGFGNTRLLIFWRMNRSSEKVVRKMAR